MKISAGLFALVLVAGCNGNSRYYGAADGSKGLGDGGGGNGDGNGTPMNGCAAELQGCYTVYAHSDHVLYLIDLMAKQLKLVGPFKAPMVSGSEDTITDFAVAPDNTLYAISHTNLYTASATDGHVTLIGPVNACGKFAVALTFTPDGNLYAADFEGAFCKVDLTAKPPTVTLVANLGGNLAISGDLVAVGDGTMYGTAYNHNDLPGTGTQLNNLLVKIDPTNPASVQTIGSTGSPKLFGTAFALGQVFGFTHDNSGHVITIDPKSGAGTPYGTFVDPSSNKPISFAGAGVNSMVAPTIM